MNLLTLELCFCCYDYAELSYLQSEVRQLRNKESNTMAFQFISHILSRINSHIRDKADELPMETVKKALKP